MDYDNFEPRTLIEMAVDHYTKHKFAFGIIAGLFLSQVLFYVGFGIKMLIWLIA